MKFVPATAQSVVVHAYELAANEMEKSMAMWAGSQLMALYDKRSVLLQEHADIWDEKLKTRDPLSTAKR